MKLPKGKKYPSYARVTQGWKIESRSSFDASDTTASGQFFALFIALACLAGTLICAMTDNPALSLECVGGILVLSVLLNIALNRLQKKRIERILNEAANEDPK
jgi:hypothetical protein